MDANICRNFLLVMTKFPDQLDSKGKYYFNDDQNFKEYCTNNSCDSDLEKINAGCLYFFNAFFKDSDLFQSVAKSNINIVDYIIIWLSYMLNLKENNNGTSNLTYFYTTNINNDKYTNSITGVDAYSSYKDLIDKKHDLTKVDIKDISKFYDVFKKLCEMYTEFDDDNKNCTKCSGKAKEFVEKYKDLNKDYNNTNSSSYNKMLSTLSTDYNNLKNKCKNVQNSKFPLLPEIKTTQISVKSYEQTSAQTPEVASSSSSIGNNLFTVLSVFGAIALFLGISYKYSLFGRRKRSQKQYLREKIKNIKRMDH
ncbi:BIR protein [Plasmodium berghei]|uniref:BIR protein n=2 Tax=Plasmodium berghei TaxID=5821 RepID=A0A509ALH9_PLABA|nr:BIR protein [Plasmodium berghei ANKA]SCL87033.1 BIR protein [Plasmodium berghei]SCN26567.1 BIR protein [Plasmodium berghei]SCO62803.1 BIR protein [Plasmodium berghei]VUC56428.1 BIR protein [Plasmodium berghei ANKA]|eukprot:XP_034422216.1 BIR protein [Plasmodium berghei ANKA]